MVQECIKNHFWLNNTANEILEQGDYMKFSANPKACTVCDLQFQTWLSRFILHTGRPCDTPVPACTPCASLPCLAIKFIGAGCEKQQLVHTVQVRVSLFNSGQNTKKFPWIKAGESCFPKSLSVLQELTFSSPSVTALVFNPNLGE